MLKFLERRKKKQYIKALSSKSISWDWDKIHYNRVALVNYLAAKFDNCRYLEIGCFLNGLFSSLPIKGKVGVDPEQGGNVRLRSDDFFKTNQNEFDLIFIDGLHTYEQVRKDVVNAIKCLSPGGFIALHDMLPSSAIEAHVPRLKTAWTGDVWKLGFELAKTPGIDFKILKIDHGVGVLKLKEPNPDLFDCRESLKDKPFDFYYDNLSQLPIISWEEAMLWLE